MGVGANPSLSVQATPGCVHSLKKSSLKCLPIRLMSFREWPFGSQGDTEVTVHAEVRRDQAMRPSGHSGKRSQMLPLISKEVREEANG